MSFFDQEFTKNIIPTLVKGEKRISCAIGIKAFSTLAETYYQNDREFYDILMGAVQLCRDLLMQVEVDDEAFGRKANTVVKARTDEFIKLFGERLKKAVTAEQNAIIHELIG